MLRTEVSYNLGEERVPHDAVIEALRAGFCECRTKGSVSFWDGGEQGQWLPLCQIQGCVAQKGTRK